MGSSIQGEMRVSCKACAGFHLTLRRDKVQMSTPPLFFSAETLHLRCSPFSDLVYDDATSQEGCCPRLKTKKPQGGDPPGLGNAPTSFFLPAWRWFCKKPFAFNTARLVPGTCCDACAAPGCASDRARLLAHICRHLSRTGSRSLQRPERKHM